VLCVENTKSMQLVDMRRNQAWNLDEKSAFAGDCIVSQVILQSRYIPVDLYAVTDAIVEDFSV